jgi:hypothetical protein
VANRNVISTRTGDSRQRRTGQSLKFA